MNWRRIFSISTPVLGLLVALVSVAGLNLSAVLSHIYPDRASFISGAEYVGNGDVEIVATNIGKVNGYISNNLNCNAGQEILIFDSATAVSIKSGENAKFRLKAKSTFFQKYLDGIRNGEPAVDKTGGLHIQNHWLCSLRGYDEHGETSSKLTSGSLHFFADGNELKGYFAGAESG